LRRLCGRGSLKSPRSRPTYAPPRQKTTGSGHSWNGSRAENDQLKAKLASMNQTIAGLNDQLTSLKAQLAVQTSGGEEGPNPLMYVLPAALAGVITAFVIYRKKKAEE
jgi:hypothetical protein